VYDGIALDFNFSGLLPERHAREGRQSVACGRLSGCDVVGAIAQFCDRKTRILVHSENVLPSSGLASGLEVVGFEVPKMATSRLAEQTFVEWEERRVKTDEVGGVVVDEARQLSPEGDTAPLS
jgi:hypothetical protein